MKLRPISVLPTLLLLMASFCVVPGALAQDEDGHEGEAIAFFNQGQDAHIIKDFISTISDISHKFAAGSGVAGSHFA